MRGITKCNLRSNIQRKLKNRLLIEKIRNKSNLHHKNNPQHNHLNSNHLNNEKILDIPERENPTKNYHLLGNNLSQFMNDKLMLMNSNQIDPIKEGSMNLKNSDYKSHIEDMQINNISKIRIESKLLKNNNQSFIFPSFIRSQSVIKKRIKRLQ